MGRFFGQAWSPGAEQPAKVQVYVLSVGVDGLASLARSGDFCHNHDRQITADDHERHLHPIQYSSSILRIIVIIISRVSGISGR